MNNDDTSTSNGGGQGRSSTLKQSSHGSTARSGGANKGTHGDNNSQITVWRRAEIVSLEFSLMFNKQIRLSEGGQGDMKHWRVSAPQTDGQDFLPPNIRILLDSQNSNKDTKKCCFIMSPWLYTVPVWTGKWRLGYQLRPAPRSGFFCNDVRISIIFKYKIYWC